MDFSEIIQSGMVSQADFKVDDDSTALHVGSGSLPVFATPMMIAYMERVAFRMLEERLPEGYSSVGVRVDMRHIAPTPVGDTVHVQCQVAEVNGQQITLKVEIWDREEKVGEGQHKRVVIDVARFMKRVDAKQR